MLSTSPLSVTYVFADMKDEVVQNREFEIILTEKIVNGRLEVQHYALPDDISNEDMKRASFEGQISSWAYVNYDAYHSGIVLFDGNALRVGENLWKISINDVLNPEEWYFDLKLNEKSYDLPLGENKITHGEDLSYMVIFSGKIGDMGREDIFIIYLMNLDFKNPEIDQNVKFPHVEELINSGKS